MNNKIFKIGILLVIIFMLYNINYNYTEAFTPGIRELYRPYVRHTRIFSEKFYGDSKNNIDHLFRKFGLY